MAYLAIRQRSYFIVLHIPPLASYPGSCSHFFNVARCIEKLGGPGYEAISPSILCTCMYAKHYKCVVSMIKCYGHIIGHNGLHISSHESTMKLYEILLKKQTMCIKNVDST